MDRGQTNRQNSLLLTEHAVPIIPPGGAKSDARLQFVHRGDRRPYAERLRAFFYVYDNALERLI